jgi:predicted MPP superfamily phosphohydrolase
MLLLLLLVSFLLIPDLYIYLMYIVRKTRNRWLRFAYWMPTLLLLAGFVLLMMAMGENSMALHPLAVGRYAVVVFLLIIPKLLFMICSLAGLPFRYGLHWRCAPFTAAGLVLAAVGFGCVLYGATAGISHFEVKEVEFRHPDLPAGFDGYRIVQLSDIHTGSWTGDEASVRKLVAKVNALNPDLILFTGDLVNQRAVELTEFQFTLSELHARDGVYSVLGNHDYGTYFHWTNPADEIANLDSLIAKKKQMGWTLLDNEHRILHHHGDSIALIGVGNYNDHFRPQETVRTRPQYADLQKATAGADSLFSILLSHNPNHWEREVLPDSRIALTLAGHTHGMQVILFNHSLASLLFKEWRGMYTENHRSLYVNVGVGYVGLPLRFGAWPEITEITLRR